MSSSALTEAPGFPGGPENPGRPCGKNKKHSTTRERETHPQGNPHVFTGCAHRKQKDRSLLGIKLEYSTLDYTEVALRITAYTEVDYTG